MIRMRLLGKVDLKLGDSTEARSILSQPKPLGLLAYLVIGSSRGFRRRDELVGIFWPESTSARARSALSQALYVIRSALGPDVIRSRGVEEVGIDPEVLWSDVASFREAFAAGRFEEALSLYEGDLLSGFFLAESAEFDQWLERERNLLRAQATESAWQISEGLESLGKTGAARESALRATELAPYNEEGLRKYLGLLDRLGDRAEAIRAFETYRQRVKDELEIEPSPETASLVDAIRERATGAPRPSQQSLAADATSPVGERSLRQAGTENGADADANDYRSRRQHLRYVLASVPMVVIALIISWRSNRSAEAKTRPAARTEQVVVADFESNVSDTALANTVRDAMRLDLSRSTRVRPLSEARVRHALSLMQRDSSTAIDRRVAREVAVREGVKAVLEGDVRVSRGGYSLSARLVASETGELVGGWRASARNSTELIGAIETLATSVRRGAGESLGEISATSPLFRVSTKSIIALRKHAMATTAYYDEDFTRALGLFEEAIAIDSTFADALMSRAVTLAHLGIHPAREVEATIVAYRHRDQLTEAEKYAVTGAYLLTVKGDVAGAIDALYNEAALEPEIVFWGRFASLLSQQRRYREAELAALNGLKWSPNPFAWWHLANIRFKAGKTAEAKRTVAESLKRFPNHALMLAQEIEMLHGLGQYAIADSLAHAIKPARPGRFPLMQQALLDAQLGKIAESRSHLIDLEERQKRSGAVDPLMRTMLLRGRVELLAHDTARALAIADSVTGSSAWMTTDSRDRPYAPVAYLYVTAGAPRRAASQLSAFEGAVPPDFRARDRYLRSRVAAMVRVANGDRRAVDELRALVNAAPAATSVLADLHWAYLQIGDTASARESAKRYLADVSATRIEDDAFNLRRMRASAQLSGDSHTTQSPR